MVWGRPGPERPLGDTSVLFSRLGSLWTHLAFPASWAASLWPPGSCDSLQVAVAFGRSISLEVLGSCLVLLQPCAPGLARLSGSAHPAIQLPGIWELGSRPSRDGRHLLSEHLSLMVPDQPVARPLSSLPLLRPSALPPSLC